MDIQNFIKFVILLYCSFLFSCQSIPPLEPVVGNTGGQISDIAAKTDVVRYDIDIELFPDTQSIKGQVDTSFILLNPTDKVQLKLDPRFELLDVQVDSKDVRYERISGLITIYLPEVHNKGYKLVSTITYSGKPHVALNAPWDGGFVWSKTPSNEDWIATAVQGEGCDLFWPCKDHFADKADVTSIKLTVPKPLVAVTNGVLQKTVALPNNKTRYEWLLSVPASDYNIALNIGPFELVERVYNSVSGAKVPIRFWALPENVDKATKMIDDDLMQQIAFFEKLIGPYPWPSEKLGFVETPHLGMEHQTINAYGKKYVRDTRGYDWLLHHELAHEWFGNVMTHKTINDAWLHEGFGLYMQPLYSLYLFGEASYKHSMYESYLGLVNCKAIVLEGDISSDEAFNSDIYGKGGWTLHTLKWLLGDELFWDTARELVYGEADYERVVNMPISARYRSTQDYVDIVNRLSGKDYTWLFDVYLKEAELPELEVQRDDSTLKLKWNTPKDLPFPMPIEVQIDKDILTIEVGSNGAVVPINSEQHLVIDPNMLVLRQLPIIGDCEENMERRKNR